MQKGEMSIGLLVALIALLTSAAVLLPKLSIQQESNVLGSVTQGNEYTATTTRSGNGGIAMSSGTNGLVLKTGTGALGSVVITGAGAGQINLYDATTTAAHGNHPTTTLAAFPVSAAAGTYVFDASFNRGLVVELTGTVGTSTITYR